MKSSILFLLTAMILGILVSACVSPSRFFLLILIPLLLFSLLFLKHSMLHKFIFFAVFFLLGTLGHTLAMNHLPKDHLFWQSDAIRKATLIGEVVSFPQVFAEKTRLLLSVETCDGSRVSGIVRLTLYNRSSKQHLRNGLELDYGDRIEVTGTIRPPGHYRNPGAFDYVSYLKRKGIWVTASVSVQHTRVIEKGQGHALLTRMMAQKKAFHSYLHASLPAAEASLIRALTTGDRSGITDDMRERFARAGAAHLLAVSGLHMGFAALFCYRVFFMIFRFLLPLCLLQKSYRWFIPDRLASMVTLAWIPFYTLLVGGTTSSIRAAIMILVYLMAKIMERERKLFHTLTVAALVILVWRPASLFEVDFQLSFAAVTALVLMLHHYKPAKETALPLSLDDQARKRRGGLKNILHQVAQLFVFTVVATAATLPVTAITFHRVTMAGLLTNLIFVPLTGLWIVPFGLAALVVFIIHPAYALWPAKISAAGVTLLEKGVTLFSAMHGSAIWVFPPPGYMVLLYYLLLIFLLIYGGFGRARRITGIFILCVLFLAVNQWSGALKSDGMLHIRFLDVGQGASTLLILPDGKTMLIDGGGSYDPSYNLGRKVILPTLLVLGIRRIDVMVLSHPHPDHLNGLVGILEELPVGEVWDAWQDYPSENYKRFRKEIAERNIPRRYLQRMGERIRISDVDVEILHHGTGYTHSSSRAVNNESLVLKVCYGDVSLLITGDLEEEGEKVLIGHGAEKLQSTIMQVPHHGSRSSSTPILVDSVRPEIAVIQVGAHNPFRLPSAEVIGRYRYISPEKRLYRTDRDGALWIQTDGRGVTIQDVDN
jgi:competence protein ComEC